MSSNFWLAQRVFHFGTLVYYVAVDVNFFEGMKHADERLGRPKDDPHLKRMLAGSAYYFTIWNLLIQQVYFSICCLEYLLEFFPKVISPRAQNQLITARRMMLPILLFPCSCVVSFNYWTIYAYSPRLVFGDFLDVINPMWINHAIHTFIVPLAAMEMFLRARSEGTWDGGFLRDVSKLSALFTAYLVAILVGYLRNGAWPYPVMDPMDAKWFVGLIVACYITGWIWFYSGRRLGSAFSVQGRVTRLNPVCSAMKTK